MDPLLDDGLEMYENIDVSKIDTDESVLLANKSKSSLGFALMWNRHPVFKCL